MSVSLSRESIVSQAAVGHQNAFLDSSLPRLAMQYGRVSKHLAGSPIDVSSVAQRGNVRIPVVISRDVWHCTVAPITGPVTPFVVELHINAVWAIVWQAIGALKFQRKYAVTIDVPFDSAFDPDECATIRLQAALGVGEHGETRLVITRTLNS